MTLADATEAVQDLLADALVVHANGMISRAAFSRRDRPEHFYMIGSMGLASSIGLGVALARPERRVVVCDGDGNVLMNLGTLGLVAALQPPNLLHLCFDNGVYASTGSQPTISARVRLDEVARAAGYAAVARVEDAASLRAALPRFLAAPGPAFVLARITPELPDPPFARVDVEPPVLAERFRAAARTGSPH
jgi:thiamine pyrophosphate-dependent acetolactate synthase large subunit-like protein